MEPLRILAVEDNADALEMLCDLLQLLGHQASGAPDAASAQALLWAGGFDVLLTDVNLPGRSGVQLAREARQAAPDMRIVFVSGHDAAMSAYLDFPAGWLTKPYDLNALTAALNRSDSA